MTSTLAGLPPDVLPALRERWPDLPWHGLRETHGAFHHVLLLPPVAALRIRTGDGHEVATRREHATAAALAAADLPVPRPVADPVHTDRWSAAAVSHVDGVLREWGSWDEDRAGILLLLEHWADVSRAHRDLATSLPAVRSWCGGEQWPSLVAEMTAHDPEMRDAARMRVDAVLELEMFVEHSAVHGDFGLHNILWTDDGEVSQIDTDHAAWADPAIDVAPLLTVYGAQRLAADLSSELVERAASHRRTLSLQVAAAAQLSGDLLLRDHALENFRSRIRSSDPQW
ncbi:hypothetical protein CFK39_02710 [Brachybacterium avium]|uniref:Aminoglycoside phosphotransferase domain-containing protein n=1 Tax=Brachybacterium avium TaxID=2017485 RepID=A0A220UAA9_9MICO|nr:phosphotransferase [Brachybacterium avium]ASK64922.1 hypothetical protein CFK39_02710 [Brachybacterium avium]